MRRLATLIAVLALAAPAAAAEPKASLPDIEDEVMCVQCGTALNVSEAPSANQERDFIRRRIAEGRTKEQIKQDLVREYGRNVLATPDSSGFGVAAYIVPALLAALMLLVVALTARGWRRAGATTRAAAAPPALDEAATGRLERDMAGYDL